MTDFNKLLDELQQDEAYIKSRINENGMLLDYRKKRIDELFRIADKTDDEDKKLKIYEHIDYVNNLYGHTIEKLYFLTELKRYNVILQKFVDHIEKESWGVR